MIILDGKGVYPGNPDLQQMVINSFYNESEMDNDDEWEDKVKFVNQYFELFGTYVEEEWLNRDTQNY